MGKYHFNEIEEKWQKYWAKNQTFKAKNPSSPPSEGLGEAYYVLDMFPYPSGAGLHVGHPLGYIASDIYARYKRHQGFNVLHPMGYDSFGLPAEQYAIQTGQHPAKTTEENIARYREQLDKLGFSFDWSREVRTSNPEYYKWTQWIFLQLFESWYDRNSDKARAIEELRSIFSSEGNIHLNAVSDEGIEHFTAFEWLEFSEVKKQEILLKYRLTYLAETEVNWCPQLGTVLANDEIVNGVSERGGYPVIRKKMKQWSMRITAYAQRLLDGLEKIDWPQPLKDSQTNWIGRSKGATVKFRVMSYELGKGDENSSLIPHPSSLNIEVFTTRPDTIFGVSFMTLAPEHDLVSKITTSEQKEAVENYIEATAKRSERERMADVKTITGVFTGAYAEHPFTGEKLPIWIGDYVLAGYGTGAVMSVPAGDQRDYDFAKHFNLPIPNIFGPLTAEGGIDEAENLIETEAFSEKTGFVLKNSDFLNGMNYSEATDKIITALEEKGIGKGKINYRLRDAVFSRQRYWGEPFPIYYKDGMPHAIPTECLPLRLPEVEKYLPTEEGEPPLGRADNWSWDEKNQKVVSNENVTPSAVEGSSNENGIYPLELNTMPGWAGSSWYFFRYMESEKRDEVFASKEAMDYWQNVDLYIGGSEHATGHLLYSRFWVKFLHDRGLVPVDEPFKKLINQGMILGESAFVLVLLIQSRVSFNINETDASIEKIKKGAEVPKALIINKEIYNDIEVNGSNSSVDDWINKNNKYPNDVEIYYSKENLIKTNIDISLLKGNTNEVDKELLKKWQPQYLNTEYLQENEYFSIREVEKMSKSKYNVVNPDDICNQYGADTLRMYEMFLGPLEQAKPWNTAGITGVHGFLKKLWKLYHSGENESFYVADSPPSEGSGEALRTLHKTIKKVQEDIENFSFNTSVSSFMIAVNELSAQNCNSREVLEPLAILISPYAPHIAEELWQKLGHSESISTAPFPKFEEKYLVESTKEYPISFNGKMRFTLELPLDLTKEEIESAVMSHEKTAQYLEGRTPNKVIIVPGKIVNIVG